MTSIIRAAAGMVLAAATIVYAQDTGEPDPTKIDLSEPTLFVVGYAHLDTQWRWTYYDTIREFIPNTLYHNFDRFEKYPGYVFNFGGSRRFEMMEEYYPEDFERLKKYVADGQWFPSGSSVDENDANVPSGESQIRQVLYGNKYARDTFGVTSSEFMLPDCFGFPAALPSLLAHCGLKGFSTQKLTWNAVTPIPFKVGVWKGPDGNSIIAALDPGAYVADVRTDLSKDESWFQRINNNGEKSGVYADYHYYGVGDQGGAPREASVAMIEQSVANSQNEDAKINVIAQRADMMFEAITPEQRDALPTYTGELQLIEHSAGSISSQAYMKRWNRKNEQLADAAEKAAVGAMLLGAREYPGQRLQDAWELVLGSQMHDILPGTSVPLAYDLSWNDEVIAANQFGAVLADSASAIISAMDTSAEGTPIVVFNPLSWERRDVVEAEIPFEDDAPKSVAVLDADGQPLPAQVLWTDDHGIARIAFVATVPPIGFASFDVRPSPNEFFRRPSELSITPDGRRLENGNYIVKLDARGDAESIFDKQADTELLSAPARIGLHYENPSQWPAWNMDWADRQLPARAFVGETGPVSFKVIEDGPARVAVEVTRQAEGSTFTQRVRLAAGGDRVEFDTDIDWKTRERSVRAAFPLTASNPTATYDIHLGTTERGNGHPNQYEYLFHQWFDLTDTSGDFGTTVMCDSKYAADKPDDNTVRLTLLFTPGVRGGYPDQQSQDIGRHHVLYAVQGHAGDWRDAQSYRHAAALNQPLIPFRTTPHDGDLGKSVSLLSVDNAAVSVQAMKKAEDTGEIVIRMREHTGNPANGVNITSGIGTITKARHVDGQERQIGDIVANDGSITTELGGYGLKAIALTIDDPATTASTPKSQPVALQHDIDAVTANDNRAAGGMTGDGRSYPAEQLSQTLTVGGVEFQMGGHSANAMTCRGQELTLPAGNYDTLYLLLASSDGDAHSFVNIGGDEHSLSAQAWDGYVGQWDSREWPGDVTDPRYPWGRTDIIGLTPGYVKPDEIAWYASHHHANGEDAIYQYSYLFRKAIDLPEGATTITLPDDPRIKIFAASVVNAGHTATPARELFDTLADHQQRPPAIEVAGVPTGRNGGYTDTIEASIEPSLYWQPGSFRYTTDGSEPSASSSVYESPILLGETTTVRTAAVDADGNMGPVQSRTIRVNDQTAPSVRDVLAMYETAQLRIDFSEPVQAIEPGGVSVEPSIAVEGVVMDDDNRGATIELASAPAIGIPYTLHVNAVRDTSPAGNTLENDRHTFVISGPVYSLELMDKSQYGTTIENTPGLPVGAEDSWTINVWVRMEEQPTNHTVLVGFGNCDARNGGQARYLTKFASGVHMWSHNQDVPSRTQYDLGRWQMVTATYDGREGKLYKDGKLVGQRTVRLSDDANLIQIAPLDPWDRRYQFEGDMANLTIWDQALTEKAIGTLLENAP